MYSFPARFGLGDPDWLDPVTGVVIVLISLAAALVFNKWVFPVALRWARWIPTELDTALLNAIRRPFTAGILLLGVYLALVIPLDLSPGQRDRVDTVVGLLAIIVGIFMVVSIVSKTMDWYLENLASRTTHVVDMRLFPLLRRAVVAIIYGLGGLLILDLLNINISPLIAGLGLGGLAVALAIQPTLANLFAGTYVMTEGVIAPGDYIELEGGIAGYVIEVAWRSTRLRTWGNNMVVVPNARFAETIITNYQRPEQSVNVYLECGVSYDSDLYDVERLCREVMDEVLEEEPSAIKKYGGWFGYDNFGDSNVNFWVFVQAKDRLGSFEVRTALVEGLHRRFNEEGIVINYPVRTLQFPEGWGPETLAPSNGDGQGGPAAAKADRDDRRRRRHGSPTGEAQDFGDFGDGPGAPGEGPG